MWRSEAYNHSQDGEGRLQNKALPFPATISKQTQQVPSASHSFVALPSYGQRPEGQSSCKAAHQVPRERNVYTLTRPTPTPGASRRHSLLSEPSGTAPCQPRPRRGRRAPEQPPSPPRGRLTAAGGGSGHNAAASAAPTGARPASGIRPPSRGRRAEQKGGRGGGAPRSPQPGCAPPAVPLLVPGGRGGGPREEGSERGRGEPVIGLLTINRHDPRGGPYQLERTQERRRRAPRLPDGSAARGRAGVAGSGFRGAGRRSGPGRVTPPSAQRARAGARAAAVERARRAPVRAQRPRPGGRCAMARLRGRPARYGLPGGGFPKWLRWSSGYTWLPSALTAVELKDCWFLLPTNNAISSSGGKLLFSQ